MDLKSVQNPHPYYIYIKNLWDGYQVNDSTLYIFIYISFSIKNLKFYNYATHIEILLYINFIKKTSSLNIKKVLVLEQWGAVPVILAFI